MVTALFFCLCGVALAAESKTGPAPLLLANELGAQVDPSKYLVSEKYDGVRAIWDNSALRFRSGRAVNAPTWFIGKLPTQPLDGELWLGRGSAVRHRAQERAARRRMASDQIPDL